ncbi:MAG: serine/threonine-protein phosphatase 6 regulatory ankyrin repeat subunit B-like, partial [Chthonomonadales bacterium]|nr:serine/threonine-protein phosphatase 6 regulatory ankyrin repeat subunit B-like [Chthonomonadales bacterium]
EGLASGANINLQGGWGTSALMLLSYCGDLDAVKDLVRRGADVNLVDVYGSTALLHAIKGKKLPVFDYLLAVGATLHDENGLPILALKGKPEALGTMLVRVLARPSLFDMAINNTDENDTEKYREFDAGGVALALLQLGALPNIPGKEGKAPIQFANDLDVVEALLSRGADINAHANDSETALGTWVGQGWIDHVKVALEHGADVNLTTKAGWTPLMVAANRGDFTLVKLLLEHHADPNARDEYSRAALMLAVTEKHVDIITPLLDAGARLETKDTYSKYTALAFAVQGHDLEITRILLSRGANVHKSGAKLLKLARDQDKTDSYGVAALLKKYGATD